MPGCPICAIVHLGYFGLLFTRNSLPMKSRLLLLFFTLLMNVVAAEPYKLGEVLAPFTSKDQHEKDYSYTPGSVRLLVVSYEMGVGKDTNVWLAKQPADFLAQQKAVFLADIHPMPGVGRVFALPKMRKYPHRIILGDDEKLMERHPKKKGHLTVFSLDEKGTITGIRHVDPEKEPAKAFEP